MVRTFRTLDLRDLEALASVVRHGGITAAADNLRVSKSSVSTRITRLEERLGARLLERNSRRVALTREGEQVLPRVQSLLAEAENLLEATNQAKVSPRGIVRMAVTPALGGAVLEHLLPALRERYPDISMIVAPSYDVDDLQDPHFDFAIRVGSICDETLVANKIGAFARILVCAPSHPAARATSVEHLSDVALLSFSGNSIRVDWRLQRKDGSGGTVMLDRQAQVAIQDFETLLRLARAAEGVAITPDFLVRSDLAEGRLVQVLPDWQSPVVDVLLAYRIGASRIRRVAAVMDEVRRAAACVLGSG
jgi:DNA-binding transcriptional LysR family regulator